jgi:hypothetical protein
METPCNGQPDSIVRLIKHLIMKHSIARFFALAAIASTLVLQQSCVKDVCTQTYTYTYFQPLYKTTAEVRANIKSNAPKSVVNPGKIYIKGNYIFLNEVDKGIHVINNSNPAAPVNAAFIDLPGNVDIAVKDNILYADFYTDLVAINISNPLNVSVEKFVANVFPERNYYGYHTDSSKVIYDWVKKTETIELGCNESMSIYSAAGVGFNRNDAGLASGTMKASPVGISGSLARFGVINDYMYAVSDDSLRVISLVSALNPVVANSIRLGWGMETLFPFKDKLFIGSNTGMLIYSVTNPLNPVKQGTFQHVRTCDPVIADDEYAYVTLHSGDRCAGFTNQLEVLNISNIMAPTLLKTYLFTSPRGLAKDGELLFICDGADGLKIFNAANPLAITMIKHFTMTEANDVIAWNNIALVIANDGLYQYDYSSVADIKLISKIAVQNN